MNAKMEFDNDFGTSSSGKLRRPWVAFFHVIFRAAALVLYLLGNTFAVSFIGVFVGVILLLSLDFWTVKNISGRIMVRLLQSCTRDFATLRTIGMSFFVTAR